MRLGKQIKLGKRLTKIDSMVTEQYDHIWDCCCDHGLLGTVLLSRQAAPHIHFVDVVPDLIYKLENKLAHFYPHESGSNPGAQWQVHCMDVSALPLHQSSGKHLVIIAGVGGDLMTEFVKAIFQKNPTANIDFLLCPVHHQFTLRQQLIEYNFHLQTEALVTENNRFYEVLLVSSTGSSNTTASTISPVGSLIWQNNNTEQAAIASAYLHNILTHHQRMQLNPNTDVQHIITAYSAIII